MSLPNLLPGQVPASFDVQETAFSHDLLGRYICNTWAEINASQSNGAYPFDVVVIGAGMFGGYCAEKLYRLGATLGLRILIIDAGAFLLPSHTQNLPQRLGGSVGGPAYLRTRDDASGTQNVIWGMPWISNEVFPGLAYCIGGRSLFWGGWSPRLTSDDLANWPNEIVSYLNGTTGNDGAYKATEKEIGVDPSTDYIVQATLYNALKTALDDNKSSVNGITEIAEAPLAVQGASPGSGLLAFDKFSSGPFLMDAIRNDIGTNNRYGDVSRRIFLLPRTQVLRLNASGNSVTSLDLSVDGQRQTLTLAPTCAVVLANGTIEATRLALDSLGIGSTQFGSPRVGNLMGHLRSNITVRIQRAALGLTLPITDLETVAFLVRGTALGRRFHFQVTAAAVAGADPEQNLWSMVPDIDLQQNIVNNQDPNWIVLTFRGIGEMQDQRSLNPDPSKSWIDLSNETDSWGKRQVYVNLTATAEDNNLWTAMDNAGFELALKIAQDPANIQYWNPTTNQWQNQRPTANANGKGFWQDRLGTTHHEAGTLFMGTPGNSITDLNGKFHNISNAYVVGPAVFPTLGSANPSLTALSLARRTAKAIIQAASPALEPGFAPLSLDPKDWKMVERTSQNGPTSMKHYGQVLETQAAPNDGYGLYWYVKEPFANFVLKVDWRIGRRDDNSGVYIRIPDPGVPNALQAADAQGHEVQIDDRGFDSNNNTEGNWLKLTGALYDVQAPSQFASNPVGSWNTFVIEANGPQIKVTLNGQLIVNYTSNRQTTGYIALQAHHYTSRVQFRNLQIKKLP